MAELLQKDVDYGSGGLQMNGYLSRPQQGTGARPGVLIVHDAFGLDSHGIRAADRLAAEGFAAFAVDLWGGRRRFTSPAEVMGTLNALVSDRATWIGRMEAARQCFLGQGGVDDTRIAAIGYCFGGSTVLELARSGGDIRGAVSFHGGLDFVGTDWTSVNVKAKLLLCTGVEDPLVPWTSLSAFQEHLRRGDVDWELDVYCRAKHSFTRPDAARQSTPDRSAYDAQADHRSWRAMLSFLEEVFSP